MRLVKPNWVKHTDDKDRKSPIWTCSVHPDGTRLATGGIDKKIKIWSTVPILDPEAEEDEVNPKLLCTMSSHTGSVLSVRWAHHGRFLASGSDDTVVMIWGIDPHGGGGVFGSNEVNVEYWKPLTRLVGHTADVIDVAWSRDDSMLASVGLDKMVWIWDGQTFDKIRKLDLHSDFVKGVTWDPVGNYLATQSDDKTVKIWDAGTWQVVQTVEKPFENSPKSTFFRRLSWSPDGAFIAASNAMNGPVFVASVIEREGWNSEISFVGHANTIQVAAFNPRLFFRKGDPANRLTASCMVALGADDFSISIWRNTLHKPLVVLQDVFSQPLLDLCWANDGHHLYGCSADGTICAIIFDKEKDAMQFSEIGDLEQTETVLREYAYSNPRRALRPAASITSITSLPNGGPSAGKENVLTVRRGTKGKKRAGLVPEMPNHSGNAFAPPIQSHIGSSTAAQARAQMMQGMAGAFSSTNGGMEAGPSRGSKRKAGELDDWMESGYGRAVPRLVESQQLRAPRASISGGAGSGRQLAIPPVRASLALALGSTGFEAKNQAGSAGGSQVIFTKDGLEVWEDQLPSAVLTLATTDYFSAAGCEDGSLHLYGSGGRLLQVIKLDSPAVELTAAHGLLGIITANCQFRLYDTQLSRLTIAATSVSHLFDTAERTDVSLTSLSVHSNGVPIIITSKPEAYAFDKEKQDWAVIASPHWSGDDVELDGPVAQIRQAVKGNGAFGDSDQRSLRSLEVGMYAARLLDSDTEYRAFLRRYVGLVSQLGMRERAEGLLKELAQRFQRSGGVGDRDGRGSLALFEMACVGFEQSGKFGSMVEDHRRWVGV